MNIVFLVRSLDVGGAQRQLIVLAKGLSERGHKVSVAVFYPGGALENYLCETGVTIKHLNKRGRWDVLSFLSGLVRFTRHQKPDVVHGYLAEPNLLTITLRLLIPRCSIVWGVRDSNNDLSRHDWLARATFRLSCLLSSCADLIIINSRAGADYHIAQGYPAQKMQVIHNGMDTSRFRPDAAGRRRLRKEWNLADSEKLIGLVGRLDPMKDHITFLHAAARLLKIRNDVRFICVGDGPEQFRHELHALSHALRLDNHLLWAGERLDMPAVYSALDIFTSSSAYGEGFANVVAEAMACGIPCVVTDVGDSAVIVGDTGVVIPPADPQALLDAWSVLLKREGSKSGELSRARIIEKFSIDRLVEQTERALCQKA